MLQFDDSCYVEAKHYHLASFSTRNSTLNTSLRKPIRMQDFIQLCDSNMNQFKDIREYLDDCFKDKKIKIPYKTKDVLHYIKDQSKAKLEIDDFKNTLEDFYFIDVNKFINDHQWYIDGLKKMHRSQK